MAHAGTTARLAHLRRGQRRQDVTGASAVEAPVPVEVAAVHDDASSQPASLCVDGVLGGGGGGRCRAPRAVSRVHRHGAVVCRWI